MMALAHGQVRESAARLALAEQMMKVPLTDCVVCRAAAGNVLFLSLEVM